MKKIHCMLDLLHPVITSTKKEEVVDVVAFIEGEEEAVDAGGTQSSLTLLRV